MKVLAEEIFVASVIQIAAIRGGENSIFWQTVVLLECHFRHFRRFQGSEEQSPLFLWVECRSSFSPFFVKTTCFRQGAKTPFSKNTVFTTLSDLRSPETQH